MVDCGTELEALLGLARKVAQAVRGILDFRKYKSLPPKKSNQVNELADLARPRLIGAIFAVMLWISEKETWMKKRLRVDRRDVDTSPAMPIPASGGYCCYESIQHVDAINPYLFFRFQHRSPTQATNNMETA